RIISISSGWPNFNVGYEIIVGACLLVSLIAACGILISLYFAHTVPRRQRKTNAKKPPARYASSESANRYLRLAPFRKAGRWGNLGARLGSHANNVVVRLLIAAEAAEMREEPAFLLAVEPFLGPVRLLVAEAD